MFFNDDFHIEALHFWLVSINKYVILGIPLSFGGGIYNV